MNIDNNAWLTLYQKEFNRTNYIYHFTSIEKAILILYGDSLRFSKTTSLNDTLEAKPKISSSDKDFNAIFNCLKKMNDEYIQLLCFSKDSEKHLETSNNIKYFSDYKGRGFALPRMWAQYAHDNDGVCFVFNKEKLSEIIKNTLHNCLIKNSDVKYISQFEDLDFNYKKLDFLKDQDIEIINSINIAQFLKEHEEYTEYNYFYKLDDWSNENEYRFLAFSNEELYIKNMKRAIVGIVIGERIKPSDEKIIKYFVDDICEIKKISFTYNGCLLQNIYNEEKNYV